MTVIDESARQLPAPPLRPFVEWYAGYRQAGVAPARHRGLPSPSLTFILTLDDPVVVAAHADPRQPPEEYTTLVGGLQTAPALITHEGRQSGVQLGLTPLGARALLGRPAGELANIDVDASVVLGRFAGELRERIAGQATWAGRFGVLDVVLTEAVLSQAMLTGRAAEVRPEVAYAWRRLRAMNGAVPISGLAAETGWSARYLNARFGAETGLSPKEAARVFRFTAARERIARTVVSGAGHSLAELAAECGYYDQAHLAREFRALAGCPPTQWVAEEFRNIQASVADQRE
ncbi:MAG TPA: helix-turn-helix domain-containing protein [Trebonia sp.]|nr:helix-turn-helix domain-containing protein [Trebonia sp.]